MEGEEMATMNRNLNLEEVNSDAFMGIPYLNYQTMIQKIIFVGSILVGITLNVVLTFFFDINRNLTIMLTIFPLIVGVAFGCNYNQDLTLMQYLILVLCKPQRTYNSVSTEDLENIRKSADKVRREEELRKRQNISPEENRKFLMKVIIGVFVAVVLLIVMLVVIKSVKPEPEIHHTVASIDVEEQNEERSFDFTAPDSWGSNDFSNSIC